MSDQILLVEDDVDLLESYQESLELAGYSVITSTTAQHGLELYENNNPCIVFSDIKLNGIDGYELFSMIRDLDSKAKVILVTGYEDTEKTIIAKNNGLLGVMTKPIEPNALSIVAKNNGC